MNEDSWQRARLIPISGLGSESEKERRATSAFLAVLGAVKEFNRALLGDLGCPAGAVETFCEVPFELKDDRKLRVDGLIKVQRGKRTWTCVVEVKTGTNELTTQQVESYLDISKEAGFDCLLTISNQIVSSVDHSPVKVDRRKLSGKSSLFHLSWSRILSVAHVVMEYQGVSDPDQAWILAELIRYMEYPGSGALMFDDMGGHWVDVRNALQTGTIRSTDEGVHEVAARWDQLVNYLCLQLSGRLGENVRPLLTRKEGEDQRMNLLVRSLVDSGLLSTTIRIPNTVAPLELSTDLHSMTATASIEIASPEDLKKPTARVNWLLRQLRDAPADLRVDVLFSRTKVTSSDLLASVRQDPRRVLPDNHRLPRAFVLALSASVGSKRKAGKGGFITDVSHLLDRFYRDVVQQLKPWTPPAPQLALDETDDAEKTVALVTSNAEPPAVQIESSKG